MILISPSTPSDVPELTRIAAATGVFKPHEIETLGDVFTYYFGEAHEEDGHLAFTVRVKDVIAGFVYFCPIEMTDRSWDLWWIAVDPAQQGTGLGRALLNYAEETAKRIGGRVMMIDTSSTKPYDQTRRFYERQGYKAQAVLPDFYCEGDDKVVFWKKL